jgi:hypothetical protein
MLKWIKENIVNNKEHDKVARAAGISREQVWVQHSPQGSLAVVSFEVKDAGNAFKTIGTSTDPWAVAFREFLMKAHGIDVSKPAPLNEQVVDWHDTTQR